MNLALGTAMCWLSMENPPKGMREHKQAVENYFYTRDGRDEGGFEVQV